MTCGVPGCGRDADGKGFCGIHQEQQRSRMEVAWSGGQELIHVALEEAGIQPFLRRRLPPPDSSTRHHRGSRKLRFW